MTTDVKNGLRARREAAGLSREQLARAVGCSMSMITQLELVPTPAMAERIARVLEEVGGSGGSAGEHQGDR